MILDVDHLEGMLIPVGISAIVRLSPRNHMESCIPILRTRWGRKGTFDLLYASFDDIQSYAFVSHFAVTNPLPPTTDCLYTIRDLLRDGPFFWATFTPKWVRHALALQRSQFQPDLPVEEGEEQSMDGFVPYEAPTERGRSRTRKDKHIAVDYDAGDGECFPEDILGYYLNSGEPIDLYELLGSDFPTAEALEASNQEARMAQFRAEMADKEIARLRDELEHSRRCERELTAKEICRAERDRDFTIPQIEERIWKQWEPIPVSPDTVEAETGAPDETGEVNQPTVPLDVNDYSVGRSMTGYFDFNG
ncbi:hypothetical protein F2Q70_00017596 [Brassica cretica]|uniref:Uncharacterized protein n=1 Tax=Brassica cretica TaxID=69181 RepID=A0A8S9I3G2_BRACR|nr:hypothetical protein F2Q70_00017596 [Brassica cretica]